MLLTQRDLHFITDFRYDTQVYGNGNRGHDYPWPYKGKGWNENELKDLLEYLKTL